MAWDWRKFIGGACLAAASTVANPAMAQTQGELTGWLDIVSSSAAHGWACVPGSNAPVSIAFYAGAHLIGVYPLNESRPDTQGICGGNALSGFNIALTPLIGQQFLNQSALRFVAQSDGVSRLLPPGNAGVADPYPLPGGLVSGLSQDALSGVIYPVGPSPRAPAIGVLRAGPLDSGGEAVAEADVTGAVNSQAASFSAALPSTLFAALPQGYVLSLFASATPAQGPAVQLGSPVIAGATSVNLSSHTAQSGLVSGIRNTLFTRWVSSRMVFSGLSGGIAFSGNYPSFSEALVTFGFTGDSQTACQQRNNTSPAALPSFTRLAAYILKDNAGSGDMLPVSAALPFGVGLGTGNGVCLLTWVSAGYPYLTPTAGKYSAVNVAVSMALSPRATNPPAVIPYGLGGEFLFPAGSAAESAALVVLRANMPLALDEIAGSVSAAGIVGAPSGSSQLPVPAGPWIAETRFAVLSAQACATLGFGFGPGNPYFSTASLPQPQDFMLPSGAQILADVPLNGVGQSAVQQGFLQSFPAAGAPAGSSVLLSTGDCLAAIHSASGLNGRLDGALDLENQSTLYLRRANG